MITTKPDYKPGRYSGFPGLDSFDRPTVERITQELQDDRNRLVPEFLNGQPPNLEDKRITKRFMGRWRPVVTGLRSKDQDCVPKGLLDLLMEKQLQQRSGARQDSWSTEEQTAFAESCRELKDLVDGQQSTASFACGGTIPIPTADTSQPEGIQSSDTVNIFWAEGDDGTHARRLTLPLIHESNPGALEALMDACSPATFGMILTDDMSRSTRGHQVSSVATLILPALHSRLVLWLIVSLLLSREAVWLYGTMARKLSLTGLQIPLRLSGRLSTPTASMRSRR